MSNEANIRDIQVLDALKAGVGRFGEEVLQILASLQKQFEEIEEWLEERQNHWQRQVDSVEEELYAARRSLSECECQPRDEDGNSPDCSYEEDQVASGERHLAACEENLETVKQWRHRLERLIADFQNDVHRLANLASSRTNSAQAFLAAKIEILSRYVGGMSPTLGINGLSFPNGNDRVNVKSQDSMSDKARWTERLEGLLREYKTAPIGELPDIRERARVMLEIPSADRQSLAMTMLSNDAIINNIANQGAKILERFVSPKLLKQTSIRVLSSQAPRSFHRNGEVHLNPSASQITAAHEFMHAVEQQNPHVKLSATEFLFARGEGKAPLLLSNLTGNSNYGANEMAFEDRWHANNGSVYAGRIYSARENPTEPNQLRATETLTMGIERLFADPLEFYQNDREWMRFVVNTLHDL